MEIEAAASRYLIGGGAILEAGPHSSITRATLHAQLSWEAPCSVALIDFEGGCLEDLRRLVAVASGFTAERFETTVTVKLLQTGVCGLEEIAAILALEADAEEVHFFARWVPPEPLVAALAAGGVMLAVHPLEDMTRAALIAEHRFRLWPARAA